MITQEIKKMRTIVNGKQLISGLVLAATMLVSQSSYAVLLGFSPSFQSVNLGNQASVDIVASDFNGEFIGAFDFNTAWDSSILSFASIEFGSALGGPLNAFEFGTPAGPGSIDLFGVSLAFDLSMYQDGLADITLATLTFDTLSSGISDLNFSGSIAPNSLFLVDDLGIALSTNTASGAIQVVSVPEPLSILLLGLGLVFMRYRDVLGK